MTDSANMWARLLRLATEHQQYFYETCSDWNLYTSNDMCYLKDFIGYALYGPPPDFNKKAVRIGNLCYDEAQNNVIHKVLDRVVEYGTSNSDGNIRCGLMYNFIFNAESVKSKCPAETAENSELVVYPVPVFKVRGWKTATKGMPPDIWYIDNSGRVYTGFLDYVTNNTLPQCTMVLPKNGIYQMSPSDYYSVDTDGETKYYTSVWLEVHESPACSTTAKIASGGDIISTVTGLAGTVIGVAAMVTPIGGAVAMAGTIGFGMSSLWTVGRCTHQLYDRTVHDQSIADKESVGAWIGIAGSTIGLAVASGPYLLTRAVKQGVTIGKVAKMTYNTVMIGSVVINGIGAGFKGCDLFMSCINGEEISKQEVALFAVHMFFLCNSVVNLKLAKSLIETTQGEIFKEYEASLRSNRHRKEFQRMMRNTRAAGSDTISSNEEIIRGINRIDDKDGFFQAMIRNRKWLNKSGVKASFSDGKVKINSSVSFDPIEFLKLSKIKRMEIIKSMSPPSTRSTPFTYNSTVANIPKSSTSSSGYSVAMGRQILEQFHAKYPNTASQSIQIDDFASTLNDLENIEDWFPIFAKLLKIAYNIFEALPETITMGSILGAIVKFIWDYIKTFRLSNSLNLQSNDPVVRREIQEWVDRFQISTQNRLNAWVDEFVEWLHINHPEHVYTKYTLA